MPPPFHSLPLFCFSPFEVPYQAASPFVAEPYIHTYRRGPSGMFHELSTCNTGFSAKCNPAFSRLIILSWSQFSHPFWNHPSSPVLIIFSQYTRPVAIFSFAPPPALFTFACFPGSTDLAPVTSQRRSASLCSDGTGFLFFLFRYPPARFPWGDRRRLPFSHKPMTFFYRS